MEVIALQFVDSRSLLEMAAQKFLLITEVVYYYINGDSKGVTVCTAIKSQQDKDTRLHL